MVKMLDEIVEKQKDEYMITNLLMSLNRQLPKALKKAFYFRFIPLNNDEEYFFRKHFKVLMKDSELVKGMREAVQNRTPIRCFYFESDSSSTDVGHEIFGQYITPIMEGLGYQDSEIYVSDFTFTELYLNSLIHGNKAASESHYVFREKLDYVDPKDIKKNKKKKIIVEAVLFDKSFITRFSDMGEGFDLEKVLDMEKYGSELHEPFGIGFAMANVKRFANLNAEFFQERTGDYSQIIFAAYIDEPKLEK